MDWQGSFVYVRCNAEGCNYDMGLVASYLCDMGSFMRKIAASHKLSVWVNSGDTEYDYSDHELQIVAAGTLGEIPDDIAREALFEPIISLNGHG